MATKPQALLTLLKDLAISHPPAKPSLLDPERS